jgi:hypothetical protein
MKKLILQHWTGELGELEKLSMENIKAYADFCGADYRFLMGNVFNPWLRPECQKIYMLDKTFDDYDVVVMMDMDMFTRKGNTKNIFTDEIGIGRHYKVQPILRAGLAKRLPHLCDERYPYWGGSIYRLERDIRKRLRRHIVDFNMPKFNDNCVDEGIMHHLATMEKLEENFFTYMDRQQWNYSSFDEGVEDAYIIHIRTKIKPGGPKQPKIDNYRALVERGLI